MKHHNIKKQQKLDNFPLDSIETSIKTIKGLLSFNFKYLDVTQGQKFLDFTQEQLVKFLDKLKEYSKENRTYWESARIGNKSGKVLVVYDSFPKDSDFIHPKHVPSDVKWARFRLEGDFRLIGFMIDKSDVEKYCLNENIFYVVFLDEFHKFYK